MFTRAQLDQSVQDLQQELLTVRQTVDSWNDEQQNGEEEHQEVTPQDDVPDLPVYEDQGHPYNPPPGLDRSPSMAGSGTTVILSSLELPLLKGSMFRVTGVMRYVMLSKLKLLLILLLLCPLPEANNFIIYHVILNLLM